MSQAIFAVPWITTMPATPNERPVPDEEEDPPRERNPDSSLSPQYEDHILPDRSGEYDHDS